MLLTLLAAGSLSLDSLSLDCVQPPIQLVRIDAHGGVGPFLIGKFEITHSQFQAFISETHYDGSDHGTSKPTETYLMDWKNGKFQDGKANYPVCYLNWHHAKTYCAWLAKKSGRPVRLPADAEWTLAASGTEGRVFPWGNTWDPKRCNWGDLGKVDRFVEAAPVGSFPKGVTPEGVYDMAGNIWEWSAEGHLRGGPWCENEDWMKCAVISREVVDRCDDKFGLRVCIPLRAP